ncbi:MULTISPECIES: hypothetical protein, partial [unclassified Janthinobacterium]|uniref:hypothetical protein n=1 Tax=unclassified Janthinobacterium TaxID=2610881 RepID=UPI0017B63207
MALPVIQLIGLHVQGAPDGGSVIVIEQSRLDIHRAIADDAAASAVQGRRRDSQDAAAHVFNLAARIRQGGRIQVQIGAIDSDAAGGIVQIAGGNHRITRARLQDRALGVVQVCHMQVQLASLQAALRIVQSGVGADIERARRGDGCLACADVAAGRRDSDIGSARLAARQVHVTACQAGITGS